MQRGSFWEWGLPVPQEKGNSFLESVTDRTLSPYCMKKVQPQCTN